MQPLGIKTIRPIVDFSAEKSGPIKKIDNCRETIDEDDKKYILALISKNNRNDLVDYKGIKISVPPYFDSNENHDLYLLTETIAILLPADSKYVPKRSGFSDTFIKNKTNITENIISFLLNQENVINIIIEGLLFVFHFKKDENQRYKHSAYQEDIPAALKKFEDPLILYVMIYLMGDIGIEDPQLVNPIIEELINRIQLFDENKLKKSDYINKNFNMLFPTIESFCIPSGIYEINFIFPSLIKKISDINDKESLFTFLNVLQKKNKDFFIKQLIQDEHGVVLLKNLTCIDLPTDSSKQDQIKIGFQNRLNLLCKWIDDLDLTERNVLIKQLIQDQHVAVLLKNLTCINLPTDSNEHDQIRIHCQNRHNQLCEWIDALDKTERNALIKQLIQDQHGVVFLRNLTCISLPTDSNKHDQIKIDCRNRHFILKNWVETFPRDLKMLFIFLNNSYKQN